MIERVSVTRMERESLLDLPLQDRALERLSQRERARYQQASALLASGGVHSLALNDIPLAGLGVYEALLAGSWAARFKNPQGMIHLAEAAVEVAQGFAPKLYGAKRVADLQARAWGELANAYRVADRLDSAGRTFSRAFAILQEGSDDPHLKARLLELEASLLGTSREFSLGLRRLRSLSSIYRDLGEPHLAGRALITLALYTHYSGESEEAIQINQEGLRWIDLRREPSLFMQAIHNHLLFLVDLGRFDLARRVLFENRRNLIIYKDRISALRLRGVEGRIFYGLGQLVSAEIAFKEEKEGLSEAGMSFHVAIVALELAMVLVGQDRVAEAEQEVIAAREIFRSKKVYLEYLSAVIFLEECLRRREATADLIEDTIEYILRREQRTPRRLR